MRLILTTLTLFFIIASAKAQTPVFTFECFKNANMTGDSCDICTGTIYEARSFNGLMVYRLGVFNKWIDEPYLIRVRPGESVEFIEQIGGSNPDKITIPLSQTGFSTLKGFVDSTFCEGASFDFAFSISDSLRTTEINPFDTISIVGRGGTTVTLDTVTHKYVIESATGGGGATNLTYSGTSSPVTLNSSTGSDVTITAGAGIGLAATSTDLTITATDPSITNETNTAFGVASGALFISDPNSTFNVPVTTIAPDQSATNEAQTLTSGTNSVTLSSVSGVGGGTVTVDTDPTDDITGSGTVNQMTYFSGTKTVTGSAKNVWDNTNAVQSILEAAPRFETISNLGGSIATPVRVGTRFKSSSGSHLIGEVVGEAYSANLIYGGLAFRVSPNITLTPLNTAMYIRGDNNNVGINTTDPLSMLHVNGTARFTGSGGQATSIGGRDANNVFTNVTLGSGLTLSLGILSATAPTNTWLIGGNTLAGTSTIGSNSNHAVEIETNGTTKVHVATSGRVGVGTNLPRADMDVRGTIGIQMPSGTTAQRPTVLAPTIRHNTTASALEYADQINSDTIWYRLTSKIAPTAGWNSGILGTSANGASVTFAAGSNHLCGTIIIQTATVISTGGANPSAITVNISPNLGPAGRPFVCISPANAAAAGQNTNFYVSTTNNSTFQLGVNSTLAVSTQYQFNYILRQ